MRDKSSEISECLQRACAEVAKGEAAMKSAAEFIARAVDAGATQKQVARELGKSTAWVNRLIQWHADGCVDTPFGPQSKEKRQKTNVKIQATESNASGEDSEDDALEDDDASLDDDVKENDDDHVKQKRLGMGQKRVSERKFDPDRRARLITALENLDSSSSEKREQAALKVAKIKRKLGVPWEQLLVSAQPVAKLAA